MGLGVIVVPVPEYEYQLPPQLLVVSPSSMSSSMTLCGVGEAVAVYVGVPAYGVLVGVCSVPGLMTKYCLVYRYMSTSSDGANHILFVVPPSP
jgi:hypothetical protein